MTKVSIIILNWNGKKDTSECLKSLENLIIKNFKLEIILVDNASTDSSQKLFENYNSKKFNFKFIQNNENLGFAEGNNIGIRYALHKNANYVMLLNNDTTVDKNLIVNFLRSAEKHKEVGIFSPKIYFAKGYEFHKKRYKKNDLGKVLWYAGGSMDWNNVFSVHVGVDEVDKGQLDKIKNIDFATGACMFITAKSLRKTKGFNKKYFTYFEDSDLCKRTLKSGFKILYTPKAVVWHKVAQSSGIGSDLNDYFISRNRMLFGMKFAPVRTKFALLRESFRFLIKGRKWQKIGIRDYYLNKFEKGSWK